MARLFTGPRGGRISTAVLRDATHWDQVVSDLGYSYLRRHDLRHTGLNWMADAGVPVHVLRKIAGHGSLTTTQRYLHSDQQSIISAGYPGKAGMRNPSRTLEAGAKTSTACQRSSEADPSRIKWG